MISWQDIVATVFWSVFATPFISIAIGMVSFVLGFFFEIGFFGFPHEYTWQLGVIFFAFGLIFTAYHCWLILYSKMKIKEALRTLNNLEKEVIRRAKLNHSRTVVLSPKFNPACSSLSDKKIGDQTPNNVNNQPALSMFSTNFTISLRAWKIIQKLPDETFDI